MSCLTCALSHDNNGNGNGNGNGNENVIWTFNFRQLQIYRHIDKNSMKNQSIYNYLIVRKLNSIMTGFLCRYLSEQDICMQKTNRQC